MAPRKKATPGINTPDEPQKIWSPELFDFVEAVGNSKRDLLSEDPSWEPKYNCYMVNQAFSLGADTIFYANEMNLSQATRLMQHDFYLHLLPAKRRFNSWPKKIKAAEDVTLLARYLGCSVREAARMFPLLTEADIKEVRDGTTVGGK